MKKTLLIFIALAIPSLVHAVVVGPDYIKLRKELSLNVDDWNKNNKGLENIKVWAQKFTDLAKLYCGIDGDKIKCAIDVIKEEVATGVVLRPIFVINDKKEYQSDLALVVNNEFIKPEETYDILSLQCTNGKRYNHAKMLIRKYKVPLILNPFKDDPKNPLQEEDTKKIPMPDEAVTSKNDVCVIKEMNGVKAPESTQGFQIIGTEKAEVSKFLKIGFGRICILFDHTSGLCRGNDFGAPGGDRRVYDINTLTDSGVTVSYESDDSLEEGNYVYEGSGVRKVDKELKVTVTNISNFKPVGDRYWKINYEPTTSINQKINDYKKYAIINSIDFADTVITKDTFAQTDARDFLRLKQIVLNNWEQLNNDLVINIISQQLVGLEEITITRENFPKKPGEKSKLVMSIIEKLEAAMPFLAIKTPVIPVEAGKLFAFNVGDKENIDNGLSFEIDKKNSHENFNSCLNLEGSERSERKEDLSCILKNIKEKDVYNITINKSNENKSVVTSTVRSFKGEFPKCIIPVWNEGKGEKCGKEYKRERKAQCGPETYIERISSACPFDHYASQRSPVCGAERSIYAKNPACGEEIRQERTIFCIINEQQMDQACKNTGFDAGVDFRVFTDSSGGCMRGFACVRYRTCEHEANGVIAWKECQHPSFGNVYKSCRDKSHGIETYKECEHEDFGFKAFKSCRDESFGLEKCLKYADN
ncbi:MAG: hypothetical protein HQK51_01720 [Oligoflexia bacterium]|nr:hypothetical protein [Oligoflexia bacterium]